jgi:gamma-glutamylcyclotransferase (GGCT)/AIG2-like uncharacterized protein YtfP
MAPLEGDAPADDGAPLHVFVYGTLRHGQANDINRLRPAPRRVGTAVLRGRLFDFAGRHPGLALPGAGEAAEGADVAEVLGEVYAVEPALLPLLDAIELDYPERPGLYRRHWAELDCEGARLRCLVYVLTDDGRSASGPILPRADQAGPLDWVQWQASRPR